MFKVKVKFSSDQKLLINEESMEIDISINVMPVRGNANKKIIQILSKYFHTSSFNIKIVHGKFSNLKVVEIKTDLEP